MEQRKALGRGIASLIPSTPQKKPPPTIIGEKEEFIPSLSGVTSSSRDPYRKVPLSSIVINPHQSRRRFESESLKELADSIRERGLIVPLLVRSKDQGYELISGERRLRASKMAGLQEINVIIHDEELPERLAMALIENIQRQDLNPIEEALGYKDLMETCGITQEEVAQKVGKNRAGVTNTLRLLRLPPKIQEAIQNGSLSFGHAKVLLSIPEIDRQLYLAGEIVKKQWSVRELEQNVAHQAKRAKAGFLKKESLTPGQKSVLDGLRRALGTQIKLKGTKEKGQIVIEYYSLDDLNRIYKTIAGPNSI